jgi:hypothetical protein
VKTITAIELGAHVFEYPNISLSPSGRIDIYSMSRKGGDEYVAYRRLATMNIEAI